MAAVRISGDFWFSCAVSSFGISCGGASSNCIFLSNAASSVFKPFSSSSFFHVLPAISRSCGISTTIETPLYLLHNNWSDSNK